MKVEVLETRANQVRDIKCPVCGHTTTLVITEGRSEGSIHCWFCSSLLGWSLEDEVKKVEEKVEDVPAEVELAPEPTSGEGEGKKGGKGRKGKKEVESEAVED